MKRRGRFIGLIVLALIIYFIVNHPIRAADTFAAIWDGLGFIARQISTFFFRLVLG